MSDLLIVSVDKVVSSLEALIGGEEITPATVVSLVINCMQIVETVPNLPGQEKKDLVVAGVRKLLEKKGVDTGILALVPSVIDVLISVEKGLVKIAPTKEEVKKCCSSTFSCLKCC